MTSAPGVLKWSPAQVLSRLKAVKLQCFQYSNSSGLTLGYYSNQSYHLILYSSNNSSVLFTSRWFVGTTQDSTTWKFELFCSNKSHGGQFSDGFRWLRRQVLKTFLAGKIITCKGRTTCSGFLLAKLARLKKLADIVSVIETLQFKLVFERLTR